MKRKLANMTIMSLVACSLTVLRPAFADDATATSQPAVAPAAEQQPPAAQPVEAVPQTEATPAAAEAVPAQELATEPPTVVEATPAANTEDVIPLIQFQDVQLTTAIENLARQARINYILDPKVGFGQLDERGNVRQQPSISIRWENVTASQALAAVLQNNGLQIVADPRTKISRITVKDPATPDPLVTKIIQLKFASPTNVMSSVQATLTDKRARVIGDIRTSQLVVLATEKEQDSVEKLIERLDTQTKQVLIEAKLIETADNPRSIKGIDWSGTLQAQRFTFGNNVDGGEGGRYTTTTTTQGRVDPVLGPVVESTTSYGPNNLVNSPGLLVDTAKGFNPTTAFLDADGVSAVLSYLNKSSDTRIIATPRAVTLDNETAHLSVTRAEPIFNVQASTQNTTGGSEVTYTNLGVILEVTPRISANNYVNLKVIPEVSRVFAIRTRTVAGTLNQADAYAVRRINTSVMIPSGNTLVLGGLMSDDVRNDNTKVPILGDIPMLGRAFRSEDKTRDQGNLMVFITPTIVRDEDFQAAPNSGDYLKIKPDEEKIQEWGAWDSGKPLDWSNLTSSSKSKAN